MERKEIKRIDSLLQQFLKSNKLEKRLCRIQAYQIMERFIGCYVAKKTKDLKIYNRTLFVTLHSSVVRNELEMIKDTLIPRLNEAAGMSVIDEIVFR